MNRRSKWIIKYSTLSCFDEKWLDSIIDEYDDKFIKIIPKNYRPLNFVGKNIFSSDSDYSILNDIEIFEDYTIPYSVLFIFDTINAFSEKIPEKDKEIYDLFIEIKNNPELFSDYQFPEFYAFCKKIQYIDITQIRSYTLMDEAIKKYNYNEYPITGTHWIIEYENIEMKVEVICESENKYDNLVDPNMKVKILDSENNSQIGKILELEPKYFNEGEIIL